MMMMKQLQLATFSSCEEEEEARRRQKKDGSDLHGYGSGAECHHDGEAGDRRPNSTPCMKG